MVKGQRRGPWQPDKEEVETKEALDEGGCMMLNWA